MSIFSPSDAPCGIFAPGGCVGDTQRLVTVTRAAHLVSSAAPVQNASGEVVLSFVSIGSVLMDLQPQNAGFLRQIQGQIIEIAYIGFVMGNPDIRVGDRAYISNAQTEVVNAGHYGIDHCEVQFKHIGR
jgi:hypothetical protein